MTGLKACVAAFAVTATCGAFSGDFWTVEVEGRPVRLERQETFTHTKDAPPCVDERKGGWYQYGRFTLRKPVEVRVRSTRSLAALRVVPAKYGVAPRRISDCEVAVDIQRPCHLSFEAEGRKGALHLFADEPVTPPPQSPDVIYYGPGEHVLDPEELTLRSGQTLFLDEGAVVFGRVSASGENVSILGSGTISGSRFRRFEGPRGLGFLWIHNATNVTVRGVAIVAPNKWSVVAKECDNVLFDDVRVLGSNMINDDGIDIVNSRNVTIRRSFIRTQDDNICTKGICYPAKPEDGPPVENILVEDCELWCDAANTFRFGFECDAPYMKGIVVRNVDVLHFSPLPNPPVSHIWSHAIFKIQTSDGMVFSGLDVNDVRIHSDGNDINLVIAEPRPLRVPRESWRNPYHYSRGGVIRNCRFADISVEGERGGFAGGIHLIGRNAEESVSGMRFSGIDYFGEAISGTSECVHVGPYADAEFDVPRCGSSATAPAGGIDFQKLIDEAAAKGGGRVVVPAGVHETKSLRLRSHVELHLEKGAVLRGSVRHEDYFDFPAEVCAVRPESSGLVLVYAWDEEDIAITGEGTVDGRGPEFFPGRNESPSFRGHWPKPVLPRPREVQFVRCRDVRLQGVTFKDSAGWTMLIRLCENVFVDGIRIDNDQRVINSDGIDFDACRHVRVGNSTFRTGDDCLILRAMREKLGDVAVCEDVVVSNCVLDSACQTIRIGCPSDDTIRNAVFRNIRATGSNGIFFDYPVRYVRAYDEGYMCVSNLVFEGYSGSLRGSAVQIVVEDGVKIRGVRDIVFRDFDVKSARPLRFVGNADSPLENLRFENVTVNGERRPDGPVAPEVRPSRPLRRAESWSWETMSESGFRIRDPFVLVDGGHYYLYESKTWSGGRGVEVRRSADLVTWTAKEPAMVLPDSVRTTAFWAPEVHRFGGKFWMFVTITEKKGVRPMAAMGEGVKEKNLVPRGTWIFSSDRPTGPFVPVKLGPVPPAELQTLDGTLYVEDGKPYMVYCHEWCQMGNGTMEYAPLAPGFASFLEPPKKLFDARSAMKGAGKITDGPFFHRSEKSGRLYLVWSNSVAGHGYCVLVRSSESGKIAGPWTKDEILFGKDGGHGMVFKGVDGKLRITFHQPNSSPNERMRIFELDDDGERLSVR